TNHKDKKPSKNEDGQNEEKQQDNKLLSSLDEEKRRSQQQQQKLPQLKQNNGIDGDDFKIREGDQQYLTNFQRQKANYFFEVNLDIENKKYLTWEDVEFYLLYHLTIANKEGVGNLEQDLSRKTRELWAFIHNTYPNADQQVLTLSQFLDTWGALSEYIVKYNQVPKSFEEWFKLGFDLYDFDGRNEIPPVSFQKLYKKMNLDLRYAMFAHKFLTESGAKPLDFERILGTIKALITSSDDEHYSHFLLPGFFKQIKSPNAQKNKKSDNIETKNGDEKISKDSSVQPGSERKSSKKHQQQNGQSSLRGQQNAPFFINPMFGRPAGFMPQGFRSQHQYDSVTSPTLQKQQSRKESQQQIQGQEILPQRSPQKDNGASFPDIGNYQILTPISSEPIADDDEYIRTVLRELNIDISEVEIIDGNNQRRILSDKNNEINEQGPYRQPSNVYPNLRQIPPIQQQRRHDYPSNGKHQEQSQLLTDGLAAIIQAHEHPDQKHTQQKVQQHSSQQQALSKPRTFFSQQRPQQPPSTPYSQPPFSYLSQGQQRPHQFQPQQRVPLEPTKPFAEQQRSTGIRQVYPPFEHQQRPSRSENIFQNQYQINIPQLFPRQRQESNQYLGEQRSGLFTNKKEQKTKMEDTSPNRHDRSNNSSNHWPQSTSTNRKDQHPPTVKSPQQQENDKSSPTASINLSTEDVTNTNQQQTPSASAKKADDNKKPNELITPKEEDECISKILRQVTPFVEKLVRDEVRKTITKGNRGGASTDSDDDEEMIMASDGAFFDANPFQFLFGGGGPFMHPRNGGRGMFPSQGQDQNSQPPQKQQQQSRRRPTDPFQSNPKEFLREENFSNDQPFQGGPQNDEEPTLKNTDRYDISDPMFYTGDSFGMGPSPFMHPVFMSMMGAPMFSGPGMGVNGNSSGVRPQGPRMGSGPMEEGYILIMGNEGDHDNPGLGRRPPPSAQ
ncbi:unnamed protein product, partial [Didymodactylos carnosus]